MRAYRRLTASILGTSLLAACATAQQATRLPSPSIVANVSAIAEASPAASVGASPEASPPSPAAAASFAPAQSAPASVRQSAPPKELVIPAINVTAPVEHVGTTPDGAMDVPKEWNDVAWFEKGYRPGERGGAVIAGHLDSTTGRAIFWDLGMLKPGDKVLVKDEAGSQRTFQVAGAEIYPYNQAPLDKIFGPSDVPMLNLVTCNGTFDRGAKNYDKRLVVYTKEVVSR